LLGCLALAAGPAAAAPFYVYRATVTILLQSAAYVDQVDQIVNLRLSGKKLVNAAVGQPLSGKPPADLVTVIAVPAEGPPYTGTRLGLLDTANDVFTPLATLTNLEILSPDDTGKTSVAVGEASFVGFPANGNPSAELVVLPFTLAGGGKGKATADAAGPSLSINVSGLHGPAYRTDGPGYYASAVTLGTVRISGKPIATVDL
jgi:hypothetical protein